MKNKLGIVSAMFLTIFLSGCNSYDMASLEPRSNIEIRVNEEKDMNLIFNFEVNKPDIYKHEKTKENIDQIKSILEREDFKVEDIEDEYTMGIVGKKTLNIDEELEYGDNYFIKDFIDIEDKIILKEYVIDRKINIEKDLLSFNIIDVKEDANLENILNNMDMSLTIKLPIQGLNNNAQEEYDNQKTLIWNLEYKENNHIYLSVPDPNKNNLIVVGIIVIIMLMLFITISRRILEILFM